MGQLNPEACMTIQTLVRPHIAQREIARLPRVPKGGALQEWRMEAGRSMATAPSRCWQRPWVRRRN